MASQLPIGITYADLQQMSREATPLYPPLDPMPVLTQITEQEKAICQLQVGVATRLRNSAYYIMEDKSAHELERYSDRFRPTARSRPTLPPNFLNKDFFPASIWEDHFNPKKKATGGGTKLKRRKSKVDWSTLGTEGEGEAGEDDDKASGQDNDDENVEEAEDYDEENEDNDYELNYFDNGEEDNDDLGDGGMGGDDDGGGDAYD